MLTLTRKKNYGRTPGSSTVQGTGCFSTNATACETAPSPRHFSVFWLFCVVYKDSLYNV